MALFICDSYYLINLTVQCNNVTYFTALTDWLAAAATVAIAFCTLATQSALAVLCTTYYVLTATKIIYISAVWMLSKRNYSVFIFDFIIFRFEHTIFYPALRTITKEHKNNTIFAFFEKKKKAEKARRTHIYTKSITWVITIIWKHTKIVRRMQPKIETNHSNNNTNYKTTPTTSWKRKPSVNYMYSNHIPHSLHNISFIFVF